LISNSKNIFLIMKNFNHGEQIQATATVNHLKEAGELKQPPPLICINRGGCPKTPITVNIINHGSWATATVKATINRNL
jgi:hypothetical protein